MIEYDNVSKRYGDSQGDAPAVHELSMQVEEGEFCVLLGPSGCGKTTLLRMTNRLVEPTSGSIRINGHSVMDGDPVALRRNIGYVIQGVGLFPHRTVEQNIGTTLKLTGVNTGDIGRRVREMLEMVRLSPDQYSDRYPGQLSGGEAQRVGVARALANDPPLLLMDEPFGAIDPINRTEIQREFLALQKELNKTVILVTHDVSEAFMFGDRIALMQNGRLIQHGTADELLRNPATDFVREFFGAEAELLLLDARNAREVMDKIEGTDDTGSEIGVSPETSLRTALGTMLALGKRSIPVREDSRAVGMLTFESILRAMNTSKTSDSHTDG